MLGVRGPLSQQCWIAGLNVWWKSSSLSSVAIFSQVAAGRQLHSGLSQGGHLIWVKVVPKWSRRVSLAVCLPLSMVPWSSSRNHCNSRKWQRKVLWCTHCSYSRANLRDVAGGSVPQCTRCGGHWTRYNGKPKTTPGSTDEKQDETGIRALLEQFLSTLPESK